MTDLGRGVRAARYLGAAALLGAGIDHIQQYAGADYSVIPTIGTLFVLNFAASTVIAIALLLPAERAGRYGGRLLGGLAALGIGVAVGSLAALLVSEQTPLFGFMESGYRLAIVISIALESVTAVLLGAYLMGTLRRVRGVTARHPSAVGSPTAAGPS
jgi:hypothetical protein